MDSARPALWSTTAGISMRVAAQSVRLAPDPALGERSKLRDDRSTSGDISELCHEPRCCRPATCKTDQLENPNEDNAEEGKCHARSSSTESRQRKSRPTVRMTFSAPTRFAQLKSVDLGGHQ